MRYAIITQRENKVRLTHMDEERFVERIQHDANRDIVARFRNEVSWKSSPRDCFHYELIPRICPTCELRQQENGALVMKNYNGLVLLDVKPIIGEEYLEEVKSRAMILPTTVAAFTGCSGQSVKVLVRVARNDGSLPQDANEVMTFYEQAYSIVLPLYRTLLQPYGISGYGDGPMHSFLMPLDPNPKVNPSAQPIIIDGAHWLTPVAESVGTNSVQAPKFMEESDYESFAQYERAYSKAERSALGKLGHKLKGSTSPELTRAIAENMLKMDIPQEETFTHIWRHRRFRVGYDNSEKEEIRSIVDAVYEGKNPDEMDEKAKGKQNLPMREVVGKLEQRYVFRHNIIMGYTEYRRNTTEYSPWQPVTDRVINDMTIELQMAGIGAWNHDVKRYVGSNLVRDYDIVDEYLTKVHGKWDGKDHIRQLARTIPTKAPSWPDWFHRFFLGMVAQWQHRNPRFGNAIVPLLISRQGYHKSDFCRQLLPPELRSWGYTDNLTLSDSRSTLLTMTQMLLICLDEFNQISPKLQEGFLKNIITMPTVKVKRPYARHVEDIPRMASFIATTNQTDTLADPSGSRRFVGILIEGDIDTRQAPNYEQLFAQAVTELNRGEKYWFDNKETEEIMRHNRRFQLKSEAMVLFYEFFELATHEDEGEWLSSAAILGIVKGCSHGLLKTISLNKFSRELRALPGILKKETRSSDVYLVRRRP